MGVLHSVLQCTPHRVYTTHSVHVYTPHSVYTPHRVYSAHSVYTTHSVYSVALALVHTVWYGMQAHRTGESKVLCSGTL